MLLKKQAQNVQYTSLVLGYYRQNRSSWTMRRNFLWVAAEIRDYSYKSLTEACCVLLTFVRAVTIRTYHKSV